MHVRRNRRKVVERADTDETESRDSGPRRLHAVNAEEIVNRRVVNRRSTFDGEVPAPEQASRRTRERSKGPAITTSPCERMIGREPWYFRDWRKYDDLRRIGSIQEYR